MPSAPNNEICRAQWHDYRAVGCYMLTASTHNRRPLLGALRGDSAAEAYVELSSLGQALAEAVRAIPDHFPEVEVKAFVVMPDHFHLQLFVARPMQRHLGAVMGWIKTETTKAYLHELNLRELALHVTPHEGDRYNQVRQRARIVTAMQANGVAGFEGVTLVRPAPSGLVEEVAAILRRRAQLQGVAVLGSAETDGSATASGLAAAVPVRQVAPLFPRGYHDRIVRDKDQRKTQVRYIRQNPQRAWLKSRTPREWRRPKDLCLPLPLPQALYLKQQAQWWDTQRTLPHSPYGAQHHYADTYEQLLAKCLRRLPQDPDRPFLRLRGCGNADLLASGRPLVPVRISRRTAPDQLRQLLAELLQRCEEEGAIPVSPFISDGEQLLKLLAKYNGYDLIALHIESMSYLWHPATRDNARLLALLAATFPDIALPVADAPPPEPRLPAPQPPHPAVPEWAQSIPDDEQYAFAGRMLVLVPWYDRPTSAHPLKPDMELANLLAKVLSLPNQSC